MVRKHKSNHIITRIITTSISKNNLNNNNLNNNSEHHKNQSLNLNLTNNTMNNVTNATTTKDTSTTSINQTTTTQITHNNNSTTTPVDNIQIELFIDHRKKVNFQHIDPQNPTYRSRLKREFFPKYVFTVSESNNNIYYMCSLCGIIIKNYKQLQCECNKKLLINRSEFTEKCSLIRDYIELVKYLIENLEDTHFINYVRDKLLKKNNRYIKKHSRSPEEDEDHHHYNHH